MKHDWFKNHSMGFLDPISTFWESWSIFTYTLFKLQIWRNRFKKNFMPGFQVFFSNLSMRWTIYKLALLHLWLTLSPHWKSSVRTRQPPPPVTLLNLWTPWPLDSSWKPLCAGLHITSLSSWFSASSIATFHFSVTFLISLWSSG